MAVIQFPLLYVPNPTLGRPLFNCQIFVGIEDLDPEIVGNQKQLNIVQEDGTVVPVNQPFVTSAGGVPTYNGATVRLDVDGNYSFKILDNLGVQKYYVQNVVSGTPITTATLPALIDIELINDLSQAYEFDTELLMSDSTELFPLKKTLKTKGGLVVGDGLGNTYIVSATQINTENDLQLSDGKWANWQTSESKNITDSTRGNSLQQMFDSQSNANYQKTKVFAHRGMMATTAAPQNTILAFSDSFSKADIGIEFDVSISSDGVLYAFHDETVDALTDGTGTFTALTSAYIDTLKFTGLVGSVYADEPIPKLSDVFTWMSANSAESIMEVKGIRTDADLTLFVQAVIDASLLDLCIIQTGVIAQIPLLRAIDNRVKIGFVSSAADDATQKTEIDLMSTTGKGWWLNETSLMLGQPQNVEYARTKGVIIAIYTPNDNFNMDALSAIGVKHIITDRFLGSQIGGDGSGMRGFFSNTFYGMLETTTGDGAVTLTGKKAVFSSSDGSVAQLNKRIHVQPNELITVKGKMRTTGGGPATPTLSIGSGRVETSYPTAASPKNRAITGTSGSWETFSVSISPEPQHLIKTEYVNVIIGMNSEDYGGFEITGLEIHTNGAGLPATTSTAACAIKMTSGVPTIEDDWTNFGVVSMNYTTARLEVVVDQEWRVSQYMIPHLIIQHHGILGKQVIVRGRTDAFGSSNLYITFSDSAGTAIDMTTVASLTFSMLLLG